MAVNKNCIDKNQTAFRIMKLIISSLHKAKVKSTDVRYLLVVKFFLFYLLGKYAVRILSTIDDNKCIFTYLGKTKLLGELKVLISKSDVTDDIKHEAEFLIKSLCIDKEKDIVVVICGSILTYEKDMLGIKHNEFDGMIIYPNRNEKQIIFLEAKNRNEEPGEAKKCLKQKFERIPLHINENDIITDGFDCYYEYTIKSKMKRRSRSEELLA